MAGLELTLFGGFGLAFDGERLPPIPSRASRSLLAHLVLHRGQAHTRDRIVATFWPDLPETRGRRRLSHTLWQVQDALGDLPTDHRYVLAHGDTLAFNTAAPHDVDVDQFERRVTHHRPGHVDHPGPRDLDRLAAALDLYAGVLLEGFDDPWVLPERERLAALHVDALGWMVELARSQGAHEVALVHARRLTHHDPLREDGHREVMRLCTLLGRTSEALRQYERCRSVLAEELGTEPARATQQLAEFVARQRGAPVAAPVAVVSGDGEQETLRLVGRDRERAQLVDGLERTLTGTGGVSLLEGEAGVGKSRLVQQVVDDAQWRGFTVAHGTCEVGGGLPYLAVAEAVSSVMTPVRVAQLRPRVGDDWLAEVGRVVPRLARTGAPTGAGAPTDAAERMREAFVRLLTGLAAVEPTLVVIEDLHDADPETLEVVQWLAGRLAGHSLHLVLAFRSGDARARPEVWEALRAVDAATVPDRVVLGPLTAFGTAELARQVLGSDASPTLGTRLHDETGGNPLFAVETLWLLRDHGGRGDGRPGAADDLPLPRSIRDLTMDRVALLSPSAGEVLAAAAVQARAVDLDTLAHVTATTDRPNVVGDAVAELLRRGLLVEQTDGYAFRYEQVRRIVVEELEDVQRRDLHARVAEAMRWHRPERVEDIAHHLDAAGHVADAVRAWQTAGARAVALHAYASARAHFGRAVELQRTRPMAVEARAALLAAYEDVLSVLGDRDEQARVLDELHTLAGPTGPLAADVARRRAWLAAHTDDDEVAEDAGSLAVTLATDDTARAAALTVLGTARCWRGDHAGAVQALSAAVAAGPSGTDEVQARVSLGSALRSLGRFDEAMAVLHATAERCAELHDRHGEARVLGALAAVEMEQGVLPRAIDRYGEALSCCREIGYRHGEGVTLVNLGNALYVTGDVLGALHHYDAAAAVFASVGNARGRATVRLNAGIVRHEVLGDDARAADDVLTAMAWFDTSGDRRALATCHHTLASLHLRAGRTAEAERELEHAGIAAGNDPVAGVQVGHLRGRLASRADRLDVAETHLSAALHAARAADLPGLAVHVLADRALVRLARGDRAGADADSRDAVDGARDHVERVHLVWWARHQVAAARGDDDRDEALDHAAAALGAVLAGLPPDLRAEAEQAVPEHAAILAAQAAAAPRQVRVRVAGTDVPTGRPLVDDDLREVVLEVPTTAASTTGRRDAVVAVVDQARAQGGALTVDDLARLLDVSPSTIRRDLASLRRRGTPVATRGARHA